MRVLVTGAAGFIGHHLVAHLLKWTDWDIISLDRLDCSSTLERLKFAGVDGNPRFKHVWHDLRSPVNPLVETHIGGCDIILHLAASTHVDRSITDALPFVYDNVLGTAHILEYARTQHGRLRLFLYFSTDEVFGSAPKGVAYKEWDRYRASNPYAATKAGGEELAFSYCNTYGVPVFLTHCMNVFGERQHPEKFVPLAIRAIMKDEEVLIHSDETEQRPGSRNYIYAGQLAESLLTIVQKVLSNTPLWIGQKLNIPGVAELDNLEMLSRIAAVMDKPFKYRNVSYHANRPGHDLRYALDDTLYKTMKVKHSLGFAPALERTVKFYLDHPTWLLP